MKPQYQTRYEWLCESYQKWLTGFTRHAVSRGMCHPNIYYFHNLMAGWISFNGEKPGLPSFPRACTGSFTVMTNGPHRLWMMIWW
ncbi:Uncharacterised protein [Escherichia coli]|nr:Uncharacterised protein [Escherichia coli]SQN92060.1 Uncharacterised protein [Escherichia coli]SQN98926.1 Uncharacterised protein [Escherichia coli]